MKVLRFKGAVQEWTIPLKELSKGLRLTLRLKSSELTKVLVEIDVQCFDSTANDTRVLERIFNAAEAKQ
jgi:hypothetical protein